MIDTAIMRAFAFRHKISSSIENIYCMDPIVNELTAEELATMHVMKHEILTALHRIYLKVPGQTADYLIKKFINQIYDDLKGGAGLKGDASG